MKLVLNNKDGGTKIEESKGKKKKKRKRSGSGGHHKGKEDLDEDVSKFLE